MRKLLALLLVLGMASAASASLQISVWPSDPGVTPPWDPMNPQDTEIVIGVSETLVLDVHVGPDGIPPFGGYAYALVANELGGDISGGVVPQLPDPMWDAKVLGPTKGDDTQLPPPGEEGMGGSIFNLGFTNIPEGTVVLDEVLFHCKEVGDTVINLYKQSSGVEINPDVDLLDRIVIHQTPEPMTLGLLGLGGLGLLRRRRS